MTDYYSLFDSFEQLVDQVKSGNRDDELIRKCLEVLEFLHESPLFDIRLMGDLFIQGVLVADRNSNILYVNKKNQSIFRIPWDSAIGHNISEFTDGSNIPISNAASLQSKLKQDSYNAISTVVETGTKTLQFSTPIRNKLDEIIGYLIIDQDISKFLENLNSLENSDTKLFSAKELERRTTEAITIYSNLFRKNLPINSLNEKYNAALKLAYQASKSDVTVLLLGETGCGKEIFSNYIQNSSLRAEKPFIKVNCSAIPSHLFESELFGYTGGAFTGADPKGKIGYFELANNGTLLLDEIGEIPMDIQAKLLRVIQDKQIMRVGSTKPIDVNVRLIAATNKDLKTLAEAGTFRSDLFYRINVFPIRIPPLRARPEDVEVLANYFLKVFNTRYDKKISMDPLVYHKLKNYKWPGNVRELENVIERWVVIFDTYSVVYWNQVSQTFENNSEIPEETDLGTIKNKTMSEYMDEYQREILIWAKSQYGTTREMAKALDVDHSTIVKKAKRLGITLIGSTEEQ